MFDGYIQRYGGRLYALCRKLCANEWEAQDLDQDTWFKAYRGFAKYDDRRNFEAWLTSICVNTYRDALRRKRLAALLGLAPGPDPQPMLERLPAPPREEADLLETVNALPTPYRLTVLLYYYCDRSVTQTAQILGIPPGTVKSRLSKARTLLRERLVTDDGD